MGKGEGRMSVPDPATTEWVPLSGQGPAGPQGPQGANSTVPGPQGEVGPTGPQGDPGPQGTAGLNGERWFSGTGAPAGNLAGSLVGDWYLRTDTGDVYEKTGASAWTNTLNLKGPTGSQGIQGPQGLKGDPGTPGAATWTLIQTINPGSNAIDFTAIPATYTHLRLVLELRAYVSAVYTLAYIRFNGDTTAMYDGYYEFSGASGNPVYGSIMNAGNFGPLGNVAAYNGGAGRYTPMEIVIPGYANTTRQKGYTTNNGYTPESSSTGPTTNARGVWRGLAAINRIEICQSASNVWETGTRAMLYGSI